METPGWRPPPPHQNVSACVIGNTYICQLVFVYDILFNVCTCLNSKHTFIYVVSFKCKCWTPAPYSLLTHHLNIVKLINIANLDNGSVQFAELIYSEHRYWDDRHGGYKPTHHYSPGRVCVCAIIRRNKPHTVDHQHALLVQNICPVST